MDWLLSSEIDIHEPYAGRPVDLSKANNAAMVPDEPDEVLISIFLSNDDLNDLQRTREAVVNALDLKAVSWDPPVHGSLRQRGKARLVKDRGSIRKLAGSPEVTDRLEKVERAIEVGKLDVPLSAANQNNATAIATLIQAVANVPDAVILAGSIFLVKRTPSDGPPALVSRTLSVRQLKELEKIPNLLQQPAEALSYLADLPGVSLEAPEIGDGLSAAPANE